mmetsp:Transcript_9345/g.18444  ORF Transcript_9345/g.18444 Transcript_9345/m.18444 type:complete len:233 (-) Transcript_9345:3115-3813(-)
MVTDFGLLNIVLNRKVGLSLILFSIVCLATIRVRPANILKLFVLKKKLKNHAFLATLNPVESKPEENHSPLLHGTHLFILPMARCEPRSSCVTLLFYYFIAPWSVPFLARTCSVVFCFLRTRFSFCRFKYIWSKSSLSSLMPRPHVRATVAGILICVCKLAMELSTRLCQPALVFPLESILQILLQDQTMPWTLIMCPLQGLSKLAQNCHGLVRASARLALVSLQSFTTRLH